MGDDGKPAVLKDGRRVRLRTYKPSDKEGLVSMYAGLSQESLRWSMPPYNRERIERMTSDLENRIIVLGFDGQNVVGHRMLSGICRYLSPLMPGFAGQGIYSSICIRIFRTLGWVRP